LTAPFLLIILFLLLISQMSADCDTVKFWLDAAGRYPVLRPDQVLALAHQVQSNPPESKRRQRAVQKLVRHNLKLNSTHCPSSNEE